MKGNNIVRHRGNLITTAALHRERQAKRRLSAAAPDLADLARNVAGLDPTYVEKIEGPVLVVAAIREWIEQARIILEKINGNA